MTDDQQKPNGEGQHHSFMATAARYSEIAFALPAGTLVGWIIGAELDKHLHTSWIYIAGLVLGTIAGFVDLLRILLKDTR